MNLTKNNLIKLYLNKKLSTWAIERQCKVSRSVIYQKLKKYDIQIRNIAQSHIHPYLRKDFSNNLVEKAYLIGFAIGDLRIRKRGIKGETINIGCSSSKVAQIKLIENLFKQYGHIWIGTPNKRGIVSIEASVNSSFEFLLTNKKTASDWILKNNKYFLSFLAGFIDAEGSFFISRNQGCFSLGNYNKNLLKEIRDNLKKLGIDCGKLISDDLKGYVGRDGYKRNKNYWHLSCYSKKHLLKLINLIRPYMRHRDKIRDANLVVQNIDFRNKLYGNIKMK